MPTPTIPGGHGFPPAPTIDSRTNCLIPFTPSAGTHIFRKLMFSEPEPFGMHLTSRPSQSFTNSQCTIGRRWPMFGPVFSRVRSEEHTSELQSRVKLVCRLLL